MIPAIVIKAAEDKRLTDIALRMYVLLHAQLDCLQYRPVKRMWFRHNFGEPFSRHPKPRMSGAVARALRQLLECGYLEKGGLMGDPGRQVMSYRLVLSPIQDAQDEDQTDESIEKVGHPNR